MQNNSNDMNGEKPVQNNSNNMNGQKPTIPADTEKNINKDINFCQFCNKNINVVAERSFNLGTCLCWLISIIFFIAFSPISELFYACCCANSKENKKNMDRVEDRCCICCCCYDIDFKCPNCGKILIAYDSCEYYFVC